MAAGSVAGCRQTADGMLRPCAAVAAAGRLFPADRGFVPREEPELLRDRGGEDARVAMFVRLQDQRLISGVTRRDSRQPLDGP